MCVRESLAVAHLLRYVDLLMYEVKEWSSSSTIMHSIIQTPTDTVGLLYQSTVSDCHPSNDPFFEHYFQGIENDNLV